MGHAAGTPRTSSPLVRGELVGLIWVRQITAGDDALRGIAKLSNMAAAAGADELVLARETNDVAGDGPSPSRSASQSF